MKEVFKEIVTRRLGGAPDSTAKTELVEELTENLNCRYEEMIQSGVEPEEAKNRAVDALGDTDELVEYLKSLEPDQPLPEPVPNEEKSDGGQIEEILHNVEGILRGALKKAKGTIREARDKVRDGVSGEVHVEVHASEASETEREMSELEETMERMEKELDAAREALEELENARDALEEVSDQSIVAQALADVEVKIGAKREEISRLEEEFAAVEDEYAALEDELDEDDDDDDDDDLDDLDDDLDDLDDDLDDDGEGKGWKITCQMGGRSFELNSEELKGSMKSAMKDIKQVIRDATNTARDACETAADAASRVYEDVAAACAPDTAVDADRPIDAAQLCAIDVQNYSGEITVRMSQPEDGDVLVGGDVDRLEVSRSKDGVLTIRPVRTETSAFFSGRGVFSGGSADVVLDLPCREWKSLRLASTYGDIRLEGDHAAERVCLTSVSGDICGKLPTCAALMCRATNGDVSWVGDASELRLESVSGDITFRGSADKVDAKTTSGDLTLEGALCAATAKSIAGDVCLRSRIQPDALEVATTSGDAWVGIPNTEGFTVRYRTISGEFTSDFFTGRMSGRSCVFNYQGGGKRVYAFSTISGDVELREYKQN